MNDYLLMKKTIASLWERNHNHLSLRTSSNDNRVMSCSNGSGSGGDVYHTNDHRNDDNDDNDDRVGNCNEMDGIASNNTRSILSINSNNNNNNNNNDYNNNSFNPSSPSPSYRNSPRLWKLLKQHDIHRNDSDNCYLYDSRNSNNSSINLEDKVYDQRSNNSNNNNTAVAAAAAAYNNNDNINNSNSNRSSRFGDDQIGSKIGASVELSMESLVNNASSASRIIHIDDDRGDDRLFTIDSPSFVPSPYLSSSYTSSPPLYPNRLQNLQSLSKTSSSSSSSSSSAAAHINKGDNANVDDDDADYTRTRAATIIGIDTSMQIFSPERPSSNHHSDEDDHTAAATTKTTTAGYSRSTIQHATNNNIMTDGYTGTGSGNMKTFTLMELQV